MPSPFPGMNPFFEQPGVFPEFHNTFIVRLRAMLAPLVRGRYTVRIGDHVYLRELPDDAARSVGMPDLSVSGTPEPVGNGAVGVASAPAVLELPLPTTFEEHVRFLEVIDRTDERVVTVLELLSPSNKYAGDDAEQYRRKRNRLLERRVNYIEIDLLRGGPRTVPGLPTCDYYVLVARGTELPRAGLWPLGLRQTLPSVPVPLRPGEPEPPLDLQAALHAVYDEGVYEDTIYRSPPDPSLSPEDAAWAAGLIPRPAAP